jgi:3-isopropylmalate dehydrogenase
MTHNILILPGDGIGPEIVAEAAKVLECLRQEYGLEATLDYGLLGGCAVDALGSPYPEETRPPGPRR